MKLKYYLFFVPFLLLSCDKDSPEIGAYDCVFVQDDSTQDGFIDETERRIMDECLDNAFTDLNEIKDNLIGEWELIGHGEGWFPNVSEPCGYLWIMENELVIQYADAFVDSTYTVNWDIRQSPHTIETRFEFVTTPVSPFSIYINTFCEKYMYGDATPVDGNMYLLEKIR